MKKPNFLISEKSKFDVQGRGKGRYENYRPFCKVREIPSEAQRQRVFLLRFKRIFEMMSHGETLALLQLDWDDEVVEIREQFPLDPTLTLKIASELNLKHPGYTRGGTIMTTDFLVSRRKADGRLTEAAYQIKYDYSDLENGRTRAKLQIEGEYWRRLGIPWCVVLSRRFDSLLCDNLKALQPFRNHHCNPYDLEFLRLRIGTWLRSCTQLPFSQLSGILPTLPVSGLAMDVQEGLKILLGKKILTFPIEEVRLADCLVGQIGEELEPC